MGKDETTIIKKNQTNIYGIVVMLVTGKNILTELQLLGERSNDRGKDPSDQDNHEDDEDEAYYSEDNNNNNNNNNNNDWHEVDGNDNTNSADEFGFEYDDDYMS